MSRTLVAGCAVFVLASCGGSPLVTAGDPIGSPYSGPMTLPISYADDATVAERSGAAGQALECDGLPYDGGGADYDSGLASVQDDATQALENLFDADSRGNAIPDQGYRIERKDNGRVLFSYDVGERTKVAFIAYDRIKDFDHHTGWGIEAWAQCDPAELPASVTDSFDIEVWEDRSHTRVPVTKVHSYRGAEHCDWNDVTFLEVGDGDRKMTYVRDPNSKLVEFLRGTYDGNANLPAAATDTGMQRDGRELWVSPARDAAYLVGIDDPRNVERWPAETQPIGCD